MRIVVTGASGFVGRVLAEGLALRHDVTGLHGGEPVRGAFGQSAPVDLEDPRSIRLILEKAEPDVVIHAAAITNIDLCERQRDRTRRVNVGATAAIAEAGARQGFATVFLSTDQIFDGLRPPYEEIAEPHPTSVYGHSKVEAERALAAVGGRWAVLRLSLVYGWGGFIRWLVDRIGSGEAVTLFTDQFRNPVHTSSILEAVEAVVAREAWGEIFHVGGADRVDRVTFARLFAEKLRYDASRFQGVTMREVPAKLPRPADTTLVTTKAEKLLGWRPLSLLEGFTRMAALQPQGWR
ncbi:MAG: NAD(P)-dependent oxidoreductase [Myxococcales bacterium]|nr:NAD(P)-dependent oxidoreductase [Myxococcales bacterium]